MCLDFNSYRSEKELSLYQHTLCLYWGNITEKTLCWRPKVPANVQQLVLTVKTVPDPIEQQKEEFQGKAEMQLLSVSTSGWDFRAPAPPPSQQSASAQQCRHSCSAAHLAPLLSQATFPGRLKINYVQLQPWCQAADWWLQDFDKLEKNKSVDVVGMFEILKVFFMKPFWNQCMKRGGRFAN